ncbi:NUDIX domain-containing protein [Hyphomicrobium sp. MC8b]|uniref:NUDIX domain-containing protein n=1 Tax=Hyphomicrobium sp. MC8b TaxID=300273 RepID=UPI00391CEE84
MKEDIPLLGRWIARVFQKYWRVARGLNLSVEACVIDEAGRTLMVQNESGSTWELPVGLVHNSENLEAALRRVLREVAGIEVNGQPDLSFFYARGKNEQTGVYLVRRWRRVTALSTREVGFFPIESLPPDTGAQTAERIRRSLEDRMAPEV